MEQEINTQKTQKAVESWLELVELGQLLHESDPTAKSAVNILEEMREEESQYNQD